MIQVEVVGGDGDSYVVIGVRNIELIRVDGRKFEGVLGDGIGLYARSKNQRGSATRDNQTCTAHLVRT